MGVEQYDVLLVEDNPDDEMLTLRGLHKVDPKPSVRVACDGAQALSTLLEEGGIKPRLVLLDLKLPKIHGLEVLATIKEDSSARTIPVVVLTSSDEPVDVARAEELGAAEYLCKPLEFSAYVELVRSMAARHLLTSTPRS